MAICVWRPAVCSGVSGRAEESSSASLAMRAGASAQHGEGDVAAHGKADHRHLFEMQRIQDANEIRRHLVESIRFADRVRLPEASKVDAQTAIITGKCLDLRRPHAPVQRKGVYEQHRTALTDIVSHQPQPIRSYQHLIRLFHNSAPPL